MLATARALLEGLPALLLLGQGDAPSGALAPLVAAARTGGVPVLWALSPGQAPPEMCAPQPDETRIRVRRLSVFYGTDLPIVLGDLGVRTLILAGGVTSTSVHYSFVDAHQHDYFCRVAEDTMSGSSPTAHEAALRAMEYMQCGARRRAVDIAAALGGAAARGRA